MSENESLFPNSNHNDESLTFNQLVTESSNIIQPSRDLPDLVTLTSYSGVPLCVPTDSMALRTPIPGRKF